MLSLRNSVAARAWMAVAAVAAVVLVAAPLASAKAPAPRYYVSLGDSLSQGVQPNVSGLSLETNQGYADQLYAILRGRMPNLKLVKFGCPGDTTTSLLTGKGNAALAKFFKCNRTGGSQLTAAQRFFKAHHKRGEVVLVTLDIGANDVDGCTAPGVNVGKCVATGQSNIKNLTPKILSGIRTSVAKGTKLAAMTLYDPVLGGYFSANPTTRALANASVGLLQGHQRHDHLREQGRRLRDRRRRRRVRQLQHDADRSGERHARSRSTSRGSAPGRGRARRRRAARTSTRTRTATP